MALTINMLAPAGLGNTQFIGAGTGTVYVPDAYNIIKGVTTADVNGLESCGCLALNYTSGLSGIVAANNAVTVTVPVTQFGPGDVVQFSLYSVTGTPSLTPFLFAVSYGAWFQFKAGGSDTSNYYWRINPFGA